MSDLLNNIEAFRMNPASVQEAVLDLLDRNTVSLPGAELPFVFALETSVVLTRGAMEEAQAVTRKLYPSLAQTPDDLYRHMSDRDYLGRFATPSRVNFSILLGKEEVFKRAVDTGVNGTRKLVIPRHTEFDVGEYTFSMQYPIECRIMSHGGLQVVYDVSRESPLQTLSSNLVSWEVVSIQGIEYLWLDVPVQQFKLTPQYIPVTQASGIHQQFSFEGQFYYCRVYQASNSGQWVEMTTTHSQQVFDVTVPTALLKVVNNTLEVHVPDVYLANGRVRNELRVDIYTTQGPLSLVLGNYQPNAFSAHWLDLDQDDQGRYTAPLSLFNNIGVFSQGTTAGGSDALSFEALRERVISNGMGQKDIPITNAQLSVKLNDAGYDLVRDIDNITNRLFFATRSLEAPEDGSTITGMNVRMGLLSSSFARLRQLDTIRDNGDRLTLLPETLYQVNEGVISIVDSVERAQLNLLNVDERADLVNQRQYLYTPFYYVLDATGTMFDLRAYYLDAPEVLSRQYVAENVSSALSVGSKVVELTRTASGYQLRIAVTSGDRYKALDNGACQVQLGFQAAGEESLCWMSGRLEGIDASGERVFVFDMDTRFDLDQDDHLILTPFSMYGTDKRRFAAELTQTFELLYLSTSERPGDYQGGNIDLMASQELVGIDVDFMGLTHERVSLKLGSALTGLWSNARTVVSSQTYDTYADDVPMTYAQNVYERDAQGIPVVSQDDEGNLVYHQLHAKGDVVRDEQGEVVLQHRQGEVRYEYGQPVVKNARDIERQMTLFFLDGRYYFATNASTVSYKAEVPKTLTGWVVNDIAMLSESLLENTELYLYPKATLGEIKVLVNEGEEVYIDAAQSMEVTYYMSRSNYRNAELRAALTTMAIETIAESLNTVTPTTNKMVTKLTTKAGSDIQGVAITGLGGEEAYDALTVVDDSMRCSLGKRLVAQADDTLSVEDDVTVRFIQLNG